MIKRILLSSLVLSIALPVAAIAYSGCCSTHGGVKGCACGDGTPLSSTCAPQYPQCHGAAASSSSSKKSSSAGCVINILCAKTMTAACVNGKAKCVAKSSSSSSTAKAAATTIDIAGFQFSPGTITVKKGTTVTWKNGDNAPHTVTGDNGGPKSGTLTKGQSYSFVFKTVGTFPYHCGVHPTMKGTVTVTP